jgi:aspartyl protease family protein
MSVERIEPYGLRARSVAHSIVLAAIVALAWRGAWATDVSVVGLFPGKAVVVINGGAPRTLSVGGSAPGGVKLVGVGDGAATLEFDGRRHRVSIGEQVASAARDEGSTSAVVMLNADGQGHFVTDGSVNGSAVRFVVDTGATLVSMSARDAIRAGIEYRKGEPGTAMTANGPTQVWRVRLNTVQVGRIALHDVDAAIHAAELPVALLGMSFLNRMDMKREGDIMTLRRRF